MDYYKILGVATNASRTQIKSAYRLLALKLHPDVSHNNDPNKRQEFARVNEAYETLNDVDKRKSYDKLIGLNKILKRDRTKNNYNGYSHDPYAPRKKVDPKHFNEPVWNAWHYGDNAISKPSVTQLNNYMHLKDNKDQAYFRKKMNSNRLNINIEEYNVNNYNTQLKQETKKTNDVKETATENLNLKRNERKANNNNNNNNDKANESCCLS
jgi:curved DNA-binding protein CbpA